MFDIGFWELVVIGVVALLVIGPERLPAVARTLGRWTAKVRHFVATTRADLEKEIDASELRKILDDRQGEINELRSMLNETRASIEQAKEQYIVKATPDLTKPTASTETLATTADNPATSGQSESKTTESPSSKVKEPAATAPKDTHGNA